MIPFRPNLDGYHDVCDQVIHHQRRQAETLLAAQQARKDALTTREAFEAHRAAVREHYLAGIGGLPIPDGEPRPELHATVTRTLDRGEYRIELLHYQSLPDVYVTAALYVPQQLAEPAPAVIFVCGHSDLAKAWTQYQAVCVDLVKNGFVVLAMDPPGQGERFQYWETETERRIIGGCTTEHTYAGTQFFVHGASVSRHFTWDAIRGVDYLCSRPEVDPARIGVTGNSGGGTQSSFLMLAEPRLAAAAPCTWIMTLDSYHQTGQAQDAEQLIPGAFVHGPDHDDYLTAMAPKPVLIGAAAYDFFPIEGTLEALARAKRIYALYGAEECVDIAIAPTRHDYSSELREAAVNWFRRHLGGLAADFRTGTPETLPEEALRATPTGQVLDAFPGSKTLFHLGRERVLALRPQPPAEAEALRALVAAALPLGDGDRNRPIHPRIVHESLIEGYPVEKLFFFSEPGICVAAVLLHPRGNAPASRTDLLLLENGTASMDAERPRIEGLLRRGHRVFVFDPRGVGAVESRPLSGGPPHDREWRLGCDAMMMGRSTLGDRVFDVLRAFDYLRDGRPDIDSAAIALHGVGSGATWAWLAAALEPDVCAITVEEGLYSFRHLATQHFYDTRRYGFKNLAYGLLNHFDLGDLLPALAPRPVRVRIPRDANGEPVAASVYRQRVIDEARAAGRLPVGWEPDLA